MGWLDVRSVSRHRFNQTIRPHIAPVLFNELQACRARVGFMDDLAAVRNWHERWPERVLSLIIDKNVERPVFIVEGLVAITTPLALCRSGLMQRAKRIAIR